MTSYPLSSIYTTLGDDCPHTSDADAAVHAAAIAGELHDVFDAGLVVVDTPEWRSVWQQIPPNHLGAVMDVVAELQRIPFGPMPAAEDCPTWCDRDHSGWAYSAGSWELQHSKDFGTVHPKPYGQESSAVTVRLWQYVYINEPDEHCPTGRNVETGVSLDGDAEDFMMEPSEVVRLGELLAQAGEVFRSTMAVAP